LIAPQVNVSADRIYGCTPWPMRALALFAFSRCVTVNRRLRHVIVTSRRFWMWRHVRVVSFNRVVRITYRAQAIPEFAPWRYLSLTQPAQSDSALFFIALVLENERGELPLFTVWERQPRTPDWLDRLSGAPPEKVRVGDEEAGRVVTLLREYLGVSIGQY
jgi:hypothetical protein